MPIHNEFSLIPDPQNPGKFLNTAQVLRNLGPLVAVAIAIPTVRAQQIASVPGTIVPTPISGLALIDTGATGTCVDEESIAPLGLPIIGTAPMLGTTGKKDKPVYPVRLEFPGTGFGPVEPWQVIGAELKECGLLALIGRDILSVCVLVYNGPGGFYTLTA